MSDEKDAIQSVKLIRDWIRFSSSVNIGERKHLLHKNSFFLSFFHCVVYFDSFQSLNKSSGSSLFFLSFWFSQQEVPNLFHFFSWTDCGTLLLVSLSLSLTFRFMYSSHCNLRVSTRLVAVALLVSTPPFTFSFLLIRPFSRESMRRVDLY